MSELFGAWRQVPYVAFPFCFLVQARPSNKDETPKPFRVIAFAKNEAHASGLLFDALPVHERHRIWRIGHHEFPEVEIKHRLNDTPEKNGERTHDPRYAQRYA